MKIIVLSLDNDIGKERRKLLNYEYEVVWGNDTLDNVSSHIKNNWGIKYNQPDINAYRGYICHFDSYYKILKKIVDEKIDDVVICEDDAFIKAQLNMPHSKDLGLGNCYDTPIHLNAMLHHPTTWMKDNKKYHDNYILHHVIAFEDGLNEIDYSAYRWSGTACIYYPNYKSAQTIIDYIDNCKTKFTPLDLFLSKHKLIKYLCYPSLFYVDDNNITQNKSSHGYYDNYLKA